MLTDEPIPTTLKDEPHWVCWTTEHRNGNPTKVPVDPVNDTYASVSDPETWATYSGAKTYYELNDDVAGLGYVFSADGPYAGIDIDDARDPETGMLEEWVIDVLLRLNSYTELSPSATGYHVIVEGSIPEGGNRNGQLEMYDRNRYFTVTGNHVQGAPRTIAQRDEALQDIHGEYIVETDADYERSQPDPATNTLSDQELLEKAMNAANGDKFQRLWNGDTSGYKSHSEADQALCNILAFWTGGDEHRIERLFSKSGLAREKWQERSDYRERTIRNAVQDCPAFYAYDADDSSTA